MYKLIKKKIFSERDGKTYRALTANKEIYIFEVFDPHYHKFNPTNVLDMTLNCT